ncbi:NAD(+) ADP-ribosyltransferase protein [Dioscorea alata]|uniref:NAD(+) ADP-ribosyltransferase protein n=1 Tax=Dioscorea alata TaxID=55571 RepID=A0ACB7WHF7_DIOAL|nr:NAD(+) ADP-ribosyltransferase protein [Dioscorea alata]
MAHRSPATTTTIFLKSNEEKYLTRKEFKEIDLAIQREDFEYLQEYVKATSNGKLRWVNLSKDPLLNVIIAYGSKDNFLLKLINVMTPDVLEAKNTVGDTALHVAAAKDRKAVATALMRKNPNLIEKRNENGEIPLLKAAHFGSANTFCCLLNYGSNIFARNKYGSNVLHCAILGNNPDLALKIVQQYENLMLNRDAEGLTPLQLMVTIPEVFRSSLELGTLKSLIYAIIPLNSHSKLKKVGKERDEEAPLKYPSIEPFGYWGKDDMDKFLKESMAKSSKKFLDKCQRYVTEGVFQVRFSIISILKKLFTRVKELEEQKINYTQTMKLIAYLAGNPMYWDFIPLGMFQECRKNIVERSMSFGNEIDDDDDDDDIVEIDDNDDAPFDSLDERTTPSHQNERIPSCCLEIKNLISKQTFLISKQTFLIKEQNNLFIELKKKIESEKEPDLSRWAESPLIVGAKMGLHDFVEQILKACPQSAEIKGLEGRNVLQVAVKHRHEKIVRVISLITNGPNPVLPSWLLSDIDSKNNTILHYAAEATNKDEGFALQMQREIKWFEMVKNMLPKDLVYSRNIDQKTAQELFNENHTEMVKSGKKKLMDIGKTCSAGLIAAVVATTSFNIPGGKDSDSITGPSNSCNMTNTQRNPFNESVGFKVFTHAYVIGLSFAICSLLLFLSLLTTNYTMEAFRKSLPIKYILAAVTFVLASLSLLVAFTCNIYVSIYGGEPSKTQNLLPFIIELTGIPILYAVAGFFGGFGIPFSDVIQSTLGR